MGSQAWQKYAPSTENPIATYNRDTFTWVVDIPGHWGKHKLQRTFPHTTQHTKATYMAPLLPWCLNMKALGAKLGLKIKAHILNLMEYNMGALSPQHY
jgi:hypothetical protein